MKSRKFPSFNEAVSYCEERGSLKYFGRQGDKFEYCVYTLTIGVKIFHINIYDDGRLDVVDERWKEFR